MTDIGSGNVNGIGDIGNMADIINCKRSPCNLNDLCITFTDHSFHLVD